MTKGEIQIILMMLMIIIVTIELIYILWRRRTKVAEMRLIRREKGESLAEKAHNMIITTESISATLANQGVGTFEANGILKEAKGFNSRGDYSSAIERAEAAKLALLRAKREGSMSAVNEPRASDLPLTKDDSVDLRSRSEPESLPEPMHTENVGLDKLPKNFMQAKFMLSTIRDQLKQKDIDDGEAHSLFQKAEGYFDNEEYSKALSTAIKAERLLDSETLDLIAEEEKKEDVEEVIVEDLVCPGCETEVTNDDAFCRKCGEKLEFQTVCPGCDADIAPGDQFCRKCGQDLG